MVLPLLVPVLDDGDSAVPDAAEHGHIEQREGKHESPVEARQGVPEQPPGYTGRRAAQTWGCAESKTDGAFAAVALGDRGLALLPPGVEHGIVAAPLGQLGEVLAVGDQVGRVGSVMVRVRPAVFT